MQTITERKESLGGCIHLVPQLLHHHIVCILMGHVEGSVDRTSVGVFQGWGKQFFLDDKVM